MEADLGAVLGTALAELFKRPKAEFQLLKVSQCYHRTVCVWCVILLCHSWGCPCGADELWHNPVHASCGDAYLPLRPSYVHVTCSLQQNFRSMFAVCTQYALTVARSTTCPAHRQHDRTWAGRTGGVGGAVCYIHGPQQTRQ
jgi:hypothetical protein